MSRDLSLLRVALATLLLLGCECEFFGSGNPDGGPMPGDAGVNDPCTDTIECRAGLSCTEGTCQPSGEGIEGSACALTGECGAALFCGTSRTCEPAGEAAAGDTCAVTAECTPGLVCSLAGLGFECREAGMGDLGDACEGDLDCFAGLSCISQAGGARACLTGPVLEGDAGVPLPNLPLWPGETCEEDDGPAVAYFHVPRGDDTDRDFYRLPFPNDARRTASGLDLSGHPSLGTTLDIDVLGRHIAAAEEDLDGFATNPVVYFRFSREYDFGSVNADRVWLVDITPGSPDYGRNLGRGWVTTRGRLTRYVCPNWLAVRRGHGAPLRPGTTYAALLLDGIRASEAEGFTDMNVDADLAAVLADAAPSDAALMHAWEAYAPLRDWLALPDTLSVPSILNAAVFTTQAATEIVPGLRTAVYRADVPALSDVTLCDTGVTSPCDDGVERVCSPANPDYWEVHAQISLAQFQQGTPPFLEPEDGGGISLDGGGVPIAQRTEDVCVVITIPKVAAAPAEGFPVAIVAHGTGGAATAAVTSGLAGTLASGAPRAITVTIDMPLHGSRRGNSERTPDVLVFNFANPRAARDNFLQGSADLLSLVRWLTEASIPDADAPTDFDVSFDASRVVLFAHSQGATHAQLMVPFEPGLFAVVLSGAGGDLTESLLTKTRPVNIAGALPLALLDFDGAGQLAGGDNHPALALFQTFYERVDPVNYGALYHREPVGRAAHVFMTYGLGDSFSTERTMMAFARSASLPQVAPVLVDIGLADPVPPPLSGNLPVMTMPTTIGLRQYTPNEGDDGHFVSTQTTDGRADVVRFLLEALAGEVPSIGE